MTVTLQDLMALETARIEFSEVVVSTPNGDVIVARLLGRNGVDGLDFTELGRAFVADMEAADGVSTVSSKARGRKAKAADVTDVTPVDEPAAE